MNYNNLSHEQLIAIIEAQNAQIEFLSKDISFNILKKESGVLHHNNIANGTEIIFIDLCNVHAANHLYTMDGYDQFVRNVTNRIDDIAIKFGGDEIVIILPENSNAWAYMHRIAEIMQNNNIYAVMCATKSHGTLLETVKTLDAVVSAEKLALEQNGEKPNRDAEYTCLESIILYV